MISFIEISKQFALVKCFYLMAHGTYISSPYNISHSTTIIYRFYIKINIKFKIFNQTVRYSVSLTILIIIKI